MDDSAISNIFNSFSNLEKAHVSEKKSKLQKISQQKSLLLDIFSIWPQHRMYTSYPIDTVMNDLNISSQTGAHHTCTDVSYCYYILP